MLTDKLKAFWKRLLSYSKQNWDIGDYPLRYRKQTAGAEELEKTGLVKAWSVQVINWWSMCGLGNSKQEAYEDIKKNFSAYLQENAAPRPGKLVPVGFAETSRIDALSDIAPHFFENIIQVNFYECFVSDLSSLDDFGLHNNEILQKINATYNLQLTDLGDGNLVELLTLIKQKPT